MTFPSHLTSILFLKSVMEGSVCYDKVSHNHIDKCFQLNLVSVNTFLCLITASFLLYTELNKDVHIYIWYQVFFVSDGLLIFYHPQYLLYKYVSVSKNYCLICSLFIAVYIFCFISCLPVILMGKHNIDSIWFSSDNRYFHWLLPCVIFF